jgi:hypothetical protein
MDNNVFKHWSVVSRCDDMVWKFVCFKSYWYWFEGMQLTCYNISCRWRILLNFERNDSWHWLKDGIELDVWRYRSDNLHIRGSCLKRGRITLSCKSIFSFRCMFFRSLFVLFLLAIVLSLFDLPILIIASVSSNV